MRLAQRLAAASLALAALACAAQPLDGIVIRVSDGDTLWLRPDDGGRPVKVRLRGIDAPEICQAWGRESQRALESWVLGRRVRIGGADLHDDHGRRLGRLLLGGEDLQARMVREGHAWSYRFRRDAGPYLIEEMAARIAGRGLFADPQAMLPRAFRKMHGPCARP